MLFDDADDDPARRSAVAVIGHSVWTAGLVGSCDHRPHDSPERRAAHGDRRAARRASRACRAVPASGCRGRISPQITYAEYLTTNQNFIPPWAVCKAGVSLTAARSELAVLGADINRALPSDPRYPDERVTATAMPVNEARVDPLVRRSVLVLIGGVALLHCSRAATSINLLLGRTAARRREYALRLALGSSPGDCSRTSCRRRVRRSRDRRRGPACSSPGGRRRSWRRRPASGRRFSASWRRSTRRRFRPRVVVRPALALATAALVGLAPALVAFRVDVAARARSSDARSVAGGGLSLRKPTVARRDHRRRGRARRAARRRLGVAPRQRPAHAARGRRRRSRIAS